MQPVYLRRLCSNKLFCRFCKCNCNCGIYNVPHTIRLITEWHSRLHWYLVIPQSSACSLAAHGILQSRFLFISWYTKQHVCVADWCFLSTLCRVSLCLCFSAGLRLCFSSRRVAASVRSGVASVACCSRRPSGRPRCGCS